MRLLLDFGGVVIRTPFELLDAIGSPPWHGPFAPGEDALWQAQQRGEITERRYWEQRAAELFEGPDPVGLLMGAVFGRPEEEVVRPEMAELIAGVERPAVLTNDLGRFHDEGWRSTMTILRRFDPLIDLSFAGVLKPAREAFVVACERLDEEPSRIVFVDDQPANVLAAADLGMQAIRFDVTDPTAMAQAIERVLR